MISLDSCSVSKINREGSRWSSHLVNRGQYIKDKISIAPRWSKHTHSLETDCLPTSMFRMFAYSIVRITGRWSEKHPWRWLRCGQAGRCRKRETAGRSFSRWLGRLWCFYLDSDPNFLENLFLDIWKIAEWLDNLLNMFWAPMFSSVLEYTGIRKYIGY